MIMTDGIDKEENMKPKVYLYSIKYSCDYRIWQVGNLWREAMKHTELDVRPHLLQPGHQLSTESWK